VKEGYTCLIELPVHILILVGFAAMETLLNFFTHVLEFFIYTFTMKMKTKYDENDDTVRNTDQLWVYIK
jgi:hypothetical protein